MKNNKAILTEGNVGNLIIKLTLPMIIGMMGFVVFNLVDTFYITRLGVEQTAALTFTFPVVLIVNNIALGLGLGTASVISRAVGEGDEKKVKELSTDSLLLAVLVVFICMIIGLNTIEPVFKLLGASDATMIYIQKYMKIWYLGSSFVVVPMVGNNIIRALGDTKTPAMIMLVSATTNIILDPILIFGIGPFPKMGIAGAAIATVLSRMISFVFALYILIERDRIITIKLKKVSEVINDWKEILYIGIPSMVTRMTLPFASGIVTNIISAYGVFAVAGYGIATRIEFFLLMVVRAMAAIMIPFVGQNYGAGKRNRIIESMKFCEKISLSLGVFTYFIMILFSKYIAFIFTNEMEIVHIIVLYLMIVPLGYGMQGIFLANTSILNAVNKPIYASTLTFFQIFIVYIPLVKILSNFFEIKGIFIALSFSYILGGLIAKIAVKRILNHMIIE